MALEQIFYFELVNLNLLTDYKSFIIKAIGAFSLLMAFSANYIYRSRQKSKFTLVNCSCTSLKSVLESVSSLFSFH